MKSMVEALYEDLRPEVVLVEEKVPANRSCNR